MKKLFAIDCHVSVIFDLQNICREIGEVQIEDWSLSAHAHLVGKKRQWPPFIGAEAWKNLDETKVKQFVEWVRPRLKECDGFVCAHPLAFCVLWRSFNKPIYAVNSTRFEHPFSKDPRRSRWLIGQMQEMVAEGQLKITANNRFDQKYLKFHTGLDVPVIPSLCEYHRRTYTPKIPHTWVKSKIRPLWVQKVGASFPVNHTWTDIAQGKAIIYIPYQASIMSFFEWYTMAMPIVIPSDKWLAKLNPFHELYFDQKMKCCSLEEVITLSDFNSPDFPGCLRIDRPEDIYHLTEDDFQKASSRIKDRLPAHREKLLGLWAKFLK